MGRQHWKPDLRRKGPAGFRRRGWPISRRRLWSSAPRCGVIPAETEDAV